MKKQQTLIFIAGILTGAMLLYSYMWYQVLEKIAPTWCQAYTGNFSVEQSQQCSKYLK